jgi:hypothetical protein
MLSKLCFFQVISPFLQYIFLWNSSNCEIDIPLRKHIQVYVVKNSSCESLYFWSYTPWKIGFVASLESSQKQVFEVKTT